MMMQQRQPAGYRFEPTDRELVGYYLPKKVRDEQLANDFVQECDVYGAEEPWLIFDKSVKKVFYVFTKLKKKSELKVQRTAGCGTWAGQNIEEVRTGYGGQVIGVKRSFTFEVKEKDKWKAEGNGHWIMHEFSMRSCDDREVVLCRIRNKDMDQKADEEEVTRSEFEAILNALNLAAAGGRDSKKRKARTLSPGEENCGQPKSLRFCNMAEREQPHCNDEPMYYKGCAQGSYHDNQQQQAAVNPSPQSHLSTGSSNQPYNIANNEANYPVEEISCEEFAEIDYDYDQLLASLQESYPSQVQEVLPQECPSIGSWNQPHDIANIGSHNLPTTAEQNAYGEYPNGDLNTNQQRRATVSNQPHAAAIIPQAYSSTGSGNQPYDVANNQASYPVEEISFEEFDEIDYDYDQLLAALQEFDPSQVQGFSPQEYPCLGSCNELYDIANTASHNLPTAEQNTYREYADGDLNTNQQQRATVFDQSNAAAIMPQAYSSMGSTSTGELYGANIETYSLGEFASTSHAVQSYGTGPNPSVMEPSHEAGWLPATSNPMMTTYTPAENNSSNGTDQGTSDDPEHLGLYTGF